MIFVCFGIGVIVGASVVLGYLVWLGRQDQLEFERRIRDNLEHRP